MAIPFGDVEQPPENADADDAMECALARMHAEPLTRHMSHNGGGCHCGPEGECSRDHTHRIPRIARPEDEPEYS